MSICLQESRTLTRMIWHAFTFTHHGRQMSQKYLHSRLSSSCRDLSVVLCRSGNLVWNVIMVRWSMGIGPCKESRNAISRHQNWEIGFLQTSILATVKNKITEFSCWVEQSLGAANSVQDLSNKPESLIRVLEKLRNCKRVCTESKFRF